MPVFIGLDLGTTGVKSTLFDHEGKIDAYAYEEYDLESSREGFFELNPCVLSRAVTSVLRRSLKEAPRPAEAVCVTSFGETVFLTDARGKPLCNGLIYIDRRGTAEAEELERVFGFDTIADTTGVKPHAMYSLAKLLWLAKHEKKMVERVRRIFFVADFIAFQLGSDHITDYSLAARSMALNIRKKCWWKEMLDAAGLKETLFPALAETGTVTGRVNAAAAAETGLKQGIPIVIGGHDQISNALGAGVLQKGNAANGLGTVDCVTPAFQLPPSLVSLAKNNYCAVPYVSQDLCVTYAFNITGGAVLKWYRDTFAKDLHATPVPFGSAYKALAEAMPDTPTGLLCLPHFAGSGTPDMDIHSKGVVVGLSLNTTRSELYKGFLEGLAYEAMYNLESLRGCGVEVDELRTVGGGARSWEWLQIRADVFGKPVIQMGVEEAGTLGCAIMAGKAAGVYSSYDEGVNAAVKIARVFEPNRKKHGFYKEQYERFKRLYAIEKTL
ncbi:MAG: hypothetical protein JW760_09505 [Spirochaetales bacterium]|nr:hypothetical protein [Spirochaetales bacterium]